MTLPPEAEAWYAGHGLLEAMRGHMASGNPARVGLALDRWRLPPPGVSPPPEPVAPQPPAPRRAASAWTARVNTCPYRECHTGCQRSRCWAGRGDRWGRVLRADCVACLKGEREPER